MNKQELIDAVAPKVEMSKSRFAQHLDDAIVVASKGAAWRLALHTVDGRGGRRQYSLVRR